jgi:hypothetical protein
MNARGVVFQAESHAAATHSSVDEIAALRANRPPALT